MVEWCAHARVCGLWVVVVGGEGRKRGGGGAHRAQELCRHATEAAFRVHVCLPRRHGPDVEVEPQRTRGVVLRLARAPLRATANTPFNVL